MAHKVTSQLTIYGTGAAPGTINLQDNTNQVGFGVSTTLGSTWGFSLPAIAGVSGNALVLTSASTSEWGFARPDGSRYYDAIVATSGGEYSTITAALAAGHKTLFVRKGTYSESGSLTLEDGRIIIGESKHETIIDFGNNARTINIDGNSGSSEKSGSISITNGTSTVSGSGTTFSNLSSGDYILIGDQWYTISSVSSNTSLTISETYRGKTLSSVSYIASTMISFGLMNITIQNTTSKAITARGTIHSLIQCVKTINTDGVGVTDSGLLKIDQLISTFGSTDGLEFTDCANILIENSIIQSNTNNGIVLNTPTATNRAVLMNSVTINGNGSNGISLGNSENINITGCVVYGNDSNGITTAGTVNKLIIDGCNISNNGAIGIIITSNGSIISGSLFRNNGTNGIDLTASECIVEGNQCISNLNYGMRVNNSTECNLTNNRYQENTADGLIVEGASNDCSFSNIISDGNGCWGVDIIGTASRGMFNGCRIENNVCGFTIASSSNADWIVTSCNFLNNTGTNFTDNGTATIDSNNKKV